MTIESIVITDLDGTLLDYYSYSFEPSLEGIKLLSRYNIPLIFCTSKSYAEVIYFREKTGNTSPFIVENGGAIYFPKGQFARFESLKGSNNFTQFDNYITLELGASYKKIREVFEQIKTMFNNKVIGFGDMSVEEVAKYLNLEPKLAALAKIRRHDEPFILRDPSILEEVKQFVENKGLKVYPGTRFYHLMGNTDKGTAVKKLVSMYESVYSKLIVAGIGEGKNDEPMFKEVDMPFLVKKPDGSFTNVSIDNIIRIDAIGPYGFTVAIKMFLDKLGLK
ncbi:MAG: HAD-IIB family hydrolase [bacterium]